MVDASPLGEASDKDLIERSIEGDDLAYRLLIERYQELVNTLVWRVVPNQADREEVCQDVFTKVYFNLKGFRSDSKFSTWLYSIAYRTAISSLRKRKPDTVNQDVAELEEQGLIIESLVASSTEDDDVNYRGLRWEDVRLELDNLGVDERTAIVLYHIHGCSIEEIATITQRPDGTVKNQLFRVRKKLRHRLERLLAKTSLNESLQGRT